MIALRDLRPEDEAELLPGLLLPLRPLARELRPLPSRQSESLLNEPIEYWI